MGFILLTLTGTLDAGNEVRPRKSCAEKNVLKMKLFKSWRKDVDVMENSLIEVKKVYGERIPWLKILEFAVAGTALVVDVVEVLAEVEVDRTVAEVEVAVDDTFCLGVLLVVLETFELEVAALLDCDWELEFVAELAVEVEEAAFGQVGHLSVANGTCSV